MHAWVGSYVSRCWRELWTKSPWAEAHGCKKKAHRGASLDRPRSRKPWKPDHQSKYQGRGYKSAGFGIFGYRQGLLRTGWRLHRQPQLADTWHWNQHPSNTRLQLPCAESPEKPVEKWPLNMPCFWNMRSTKCARDWSESSMSYVYQIIIK